MSDARRIVADVLDGTVSHIVVDGTLYRVEQDDYDADPYLVTVGPFEPECDDGE
jgi:hypothetical protein